MGRCFVMQPFDKGIYDKRYEDVFKVAILEAGLEPYRADLDPSVTIPIESIQREIINAEVCLAEISTDNPNVWFELGFAIACKKDVILVCSNQRQTKFPFDIQHRTIITYSTDSPRDFETLKSEIVNRLIAILNARNTNHLVDKEKNHNSSLNDLCRVDSRKVSRINEDAGYERMLSLIPSNESAVYNYIQNNNLLNRCNRIDLLLYTYETLATILRNDLVNFTDSLTLRVLIRDPRHDKLKANSLKTSISIMSEIVAQNPGIIFNVRFYQESPLLRLYLFHPKDKPRGLIGFYKYDSKHMIKFVGASKNYLIKAESNSRFEDHYFNLFQGRFDYAWYIQNEQKAVIFDLDGVIIDSMPYHYQAWKLAFAEVGINIFEEEVYVGEGKKSEDFVKDLYHNRTGKFPLLNLVESIIANKNTYYEKYLELKIMPGMRELIYLLKKKHIKLALVTGSSRQTINEIKKIDILFNQFDVMITSDDTVRGKPSPDPYLRAVDELGIEPASCTVIENSPNGIKSAVDAKLTCLALKSSKFFSTVDLKKAGAKFIYEDVNELRRHLYWIDTNLELEKFIDMFEDVI